MSSRSSDGTRRTAPLQDQLVVFVVAAKQGHRGVVPQPFDIVHGLLPDALDKLVVRWVHSARELEVLPD